MATALLALAGPLSAQILVPDDNVPGVLVREVRVVADGARAAGPYTEAVATAGLPAGVYVLRLDADGRVESRRFTVLR